MLNPFGLAGVPTAAEVRRYRLGDRARARPRGRHQQLLEERASYLGGMAGAGTLYRKMEWLALPTLHRRDGCSGLTATLTLV